MYTMKEVCTKININYETLKFYCKEGLVPNVKRDKNNYRIFDDRNIEWLKSLQCLKKCGLSIKDMKLYLNYCLEGPATIMQRKSMLSERKEILMKSLLEIQNSIQFIDQKQAFFDNILSGKTEYSSNIIDVSKLK